MNYKRGQGLSTSTIILLILGLIILIILVIGFTSGWKKLAPWIPSNNIQSISSSCSVACSTHDVYSYCSLNRTLKAKDLPGGKKEVIGNCSFFSTNKDYKSFGIKACPGLCSE